jgi:hypothetical protein
MGLAYVDPPWRRLQFPPNKLDSTPASRPRKEVRPVGGAVQQERDLAGRNRGAAISSPPPSMLCSRLPTGDREEQWGVEASDTRGTTASYRRNRINRYYSSFFFTSEPARVGMNGCSPRVRAHRWEHMRGAGKPRPIGKRCFRKYYERLTQTLEIRELLGRPWSAG